MSSSQKMDDALLALAKQQLRLPNNTSPPKEYLAELKKHISIFPDDTNFYIIRQPGSGFGVATCLEKGCNETSMKLSRSNMTPDGGRNEGVGSLMAYREHINNHPTHKSNRKARLAQNASSTTRSLNSRSNSNSSSSGDPSGSSKSRLKLLSVVDRTGSPVTPSSLSGALRSDGSNGGPSQSPGLALDPVPLLTSRKHLLDRDPGGREGQSSQNRLAFRALNPEVHTMAEATSSVPSSKKQKTRGKIPFAPHDDNRSSRSPPALPVSSITNQSLVTPAASTSMTPSLPITMNESSPAAQEISPALNPHIARLQLPHMPAPLQTQMAHDPLFRAMERMSGLPNPVGSLRGLELADDDDPYNDYEGPYDLGRGIIRNPAARIEELHDFFQNAGNAELFDSNASVTKALERLNLPNLNTRFPGLEIVLMPHQVIGVAWMLDKEKSVNKGGILADEMGLGKTVQMIATIMANRSDDPAVKTTLIVAPLALLGQWKLEIEDKANNRLSVHIYHGAEKAKMRKVLQKHDVVLTTYGTLAQEWFDAEAYEKQLEMEAQGKKKKKNGFFTSDSEEDRAPRKKKKKSGLLFIMNWYRIVLDEAQNVRNKRTRSSKAVTELEATYRWCLTGTPITNGLEDAFGLLRFLRIRPWCEWEEFGGHIVVRSKREPTLCSTRLQAIFAICLLRRKKDSKLDGKNLIELPPKDVQLVKLEFTPEEKDIYSAVETRSQIRFNRYLRAGTVLKNYAQVLVLLLRLRQICTHTSLITEADGVIIDDELENMDEDKRDDIIKALNELGRGYVDKLKKKLKDVALERVVAERKSADAAAEGEECPICFDNLTDPVVTACMHFFCQECINAHLAVPAPDDGEMGRDERACPVCRGPVSKKKLFSRAAFEPTDEELDLGRGFVKGEVEERIKPFVKAEDQEPALGRRKVKNEDRDEVKSFVSDEDDEMPNVSSLLKSGGKGKAKKPSEKPRKSRKKRPRRLVLDSDEEGEDDDDDLSDFIVHTDEDEEEKDKCRVLRKRLGKRRASSPVDYQESESDDSDDDDVVFGRKKSTPEVDPAPIKAMSKLLPSTKMKHMMNNLENWAKEYPEEKTMVISQWTQALDLVSAYLVRRGIEHVKFQGNMNREKRDKAVRTFMKKRDATVMLMSLKCGGVGLNLTRANRVISLDLGWSEAVENQAFDRVHRLGQTRPVFVERLVISNTVEDRVLALQEKKRNLADGSLGEGDGKKIGRLSVRELANLFGLDQYGNRLQG